MKDQEHHSQLELRLGQPCNEESTIKSVLKNNPSSKTQNPVPSNKLLIMNNQIQTSPQGLSQPCDSIAVSAKTNVPNRPQKRDTPASMVGWPPIRSCRRNLASGISLKPNSETQKLVQIKGHDDKKIENCKKGIFVKINMEGVPVGRKVDLKAYDSYEKLSNAVDDLFKYLLAAQVGKSRKQMGEKAITGLLDASGEYTLLYEDNEGDKLLVGDVPWDMFVSAVKRLRVLKRSEVSKLHLVASKKRTLSLSNQDEM